MQIVSLWGLGNHIGYVVGCLCDYLARGPSVACHLFGPVVFVGLCLVWRVTALSIYGFPWSGPICGRAGDYF